MADCAPTGPCHDAVLSSENSGTATTKAVHSLVLDTGPLIRNDPTISTLLAQTERLYAIPSVIQEIRDTATRSRVETTLLPFLTLRSPQPDNVRAVQSFARKTGDLAVLSKVDLESLALCREIECERNGGDWRLRDTPAQSRLNGWPNKPSETRQGDAGRTDSTTPNDSQRKEGAASMLADSEAPQCSSEAASFGRLADDLQRDLYLTEASTSLGDEVSDATFVGNSSSEVHQASAQRSPGEEEISQLSRHTQEQSTDQELSIEKSDDEDGWITPSNLQKQRHRDKGWATPAQSPQKILQAAIITSDFAMQNVALRMNLNLLTPSLSRITRLKNWVLRCHACFAITKDMDKQFCPRCGQATLIRTSCSIDSHGAFKVYLKKNFQWNNRGNIYSVPKPVHGSAGRKQARSAAGKNGWGQDLILAEDQKEYVRASEEQRRTRKKDLMDQDSLPDILSGRRSATGGRIRVGAGRNVNTKRKH